MTCQDNLPEAHLPGDSRFMKVTVNTSHEREDFKTSASEINSWTYPLKLEVRGVMERRGSIGTLSTAEFSVQI